jgi:hypothetical protein
MARNNTKSPVQCIYLFIFGRVKTLRETLNIDAKYEDESYVAKYGRTEDLLRITREYDKKFGKICPYMKLKYYAWIDDVKHITEVEAKIKNQFKLTKPQIEYDNTKGLVIIKKGELKEIKELFEYILIKYSSRLKSMIIYYEMKISETKNKCLRYKQKCEILELKLKFEKDIIEQEREYFKQECEYLKNKLQDERKIHELELQLKK